ncbi:MAG: cytochrome c [Thiomicrorhabdus sp.]|nr:cytochrome c [Thiomicrorhabdus sp.]
MKKTNLILISALFASGLFVNAHAGVIDRATMLSNTCAGCHGPNGISHGEIPSIAGLSKELISISMHDFASGKLPSTVMQRIAKGYSDADIKALSEYFSKLPSKAAEANASNDHNDHNH